MGFSISKVFGKSAGAILGTVVAGPVGYLLGSSYDSQREATKAQKQYQKEQRAYIAKQEADALETRKQQINQMREQLNIGGYDTRATTQTAGVTGYLDNKNLLG
jgi:acyl-CoA reductase-like NAD-dependent aldehyde dehydrogenase